MDYREKLGKVALLLTGGGSRGPIQLGFIQAFLESGIHFDGIYAGSVGALNGFMLAQNDLTELVDLWLTIQNKDVYKQRILSLWTLFTNDASIYDNSPLEKLIRKYFKYDKIKELPYPFIVNTTNLSTMKPDCKDLRKLPYEDCIKYLRASASPPILFPSVTYDGQELADCGISNNYFITQAANDGYDTLLCMTPTNATIKPIKNLIDLIQATISVSCYNYLDREAKAVADYNREISIINKDLPAGNKAKKLNLVNFKPEVSWDQGIIDFNYKVDRQSLIKFGYNIGREKIKELLNSI